MPATPDPILADHLAWLGYVQPEGLVVSAAALKDAQAVIDRAQLGELQRRLTDHVSELRLTESDTAETALGVAEVPRFLAEFLGWPVDLVVGWDVARPLPSDLTVSLPEFGETLTPTYAVQEPKPKDGASPWLLLVQVHPPTTDLTQPAASHDRGWHASPARKFERLLRESRVPIGLLTNGVAFQLVYAPAKENSGALTFPVAAMSEVSGRLILGAFHLLLQSWTLFNAPGEARLPALLQRSRDYQASVSEELAEQVLHALHELLRGFEAADAQAKGFLLRELAARQPQDIYGGLITVLLRLVFVLYAEDRGLLPMTGLYVRHYSVRGLFERLRADAERYPDTMDLRYGAWAQLLALFRLIHGGCEHAEMKMPPREGHLFDPQRYPFLEGRAEASAGLGPLPLVSDGVVHRILEKLCLLGGERVSYRTLDVEEIGSVYQTIMGFGVEVVAGTAVAIKGKRKGGGVPAAPVINLEVLLNLPGKDRPKWLKEQADTELSGEANKRLKSAETLDDLLAALEKRIDRHATPAPVPKGGLVLQPTDERRRSGSHYTPRSFTEPIVRKTLEPILKRFGDRPTPAQILDLKIADIAVGSAAFLVEACRQLGDALVRAWRVHGGRPPLPPDETEELLAMRLVAQRCLYGVDRNPMAVDLAKLSLWLATLAKDHPFTFLDHSIRCGDSLVGLTREQIACFSWLRPKKDQQLSLIRELLDKRIKAATSYRREILEAGDLVLPALKGQKLKLADEALTEIRLIGDAVVAAFFAADKDKAREGRRIEVADRISECLRTMDLKLSPTAEVNALRSGEFPVMPFHWEIEFPEVFDRENPGFDGIVGNPPFLGGKRISTVSGDNYREWLAAIHAESNSNSDLVAHFFRAAFTGLRQKGRFGLIATNTIGQGDTRSSGLRWICTHGGTIYAARKRYKWPGQAAVVVSVVWIAKEILSGPFEIEDTSVPQITAYLFHAGGNDNPATLAMSSSRSFIGSYVMGLGFLFDDKDDSGETTPISEMRRLIAIDPKNKEVIFPYLSGGDLNDSPTHVHNRCVINFGDRTLEEARRWSDLISIVEKKVKPYRETLKRDVYRTRWWQFGEKQSALYFAIGKKSRVLACSLVSTHLAWAFIKAATVFAHKLCVVPFEQQGFFCVLQSRPHEIWSRFVSSTLGDALNYSPTDCFETFPFPAGFETNVAVEAAGREYYEFRAALMMRHNEGLTKTYNRFHDPEETNPDILKLRELHAQMDAAVLTAYGWTDLLADCRCEFLLDYEDDDSGAGAEESVGRKKKKPWRYRWPDEIRDEVLVRLLKLNAERAEEERRTGLGASPQIPKSKGASRPRRLTGKENGVQVAAVPRTRQQELF
jgi:hypothetical protein